MDAPVSVDGENNEKREEKTGKKRNSESVERGCVPFTVDSGEQPGLPAENPHCCGLQAASPPLRDMVSGSHRSRRQPQRSSYMGGGAERRMRGLWKLSFYFPWVWKKPIHMKGNTCRQVAKETCVHSQQTPALGFAALHSGFRSRCSAQPRTAFCTAGSPAGRGAPWCT